MAPASRVASIAGAMAGAEVSGSEIRKRGMPAAAASRAKRRGAVVWVVVLAAAVGPRRRVGLVRRNDCGMRRAEFGRRTTDGGRRTGRLPSAVRRLPIRNRQGRIAVDGDLADELQQAAGAVTAGGEVEEGRRFLDE